MDKNSLFVVTQEATAKNSPMMQRSHERRGSRVSMDPRGSLVPENIMQSQQNIHIDMRNFNDLPDKIILHCFSFLKHKEIGYIGRVCKKWRLLAYDGRLWSRVSLRPDYGGVHVSNVDALISYIGVRFSSHLRYIELPSELITIPVLMELANKCQNLKFLTLDFSNAMQLHEFNDLNAFPCNLKNLTICLSEVIFLEGFMRKVYQSLSSIEVLHLVGTFEQGDEAEEEIYEVINVAKIKAHTPNLKVVNLYGISFIDDSHIESLSSNCIHLSVLAINFCLRVKGASLRHIVQRCKKLKTLLMQHCGLEDQYMKAVEWHNSVINELDITSTELSTETLMDMLTRMPGFTYLGLGYCEFFSDKILEELMKRGKLDSLKALDISHTPGLSEHAIFQFIKQHGHHLEGLLVSGKQKLAEQFFLNIIPFMKKIRILSMGTANGWFLRMSTKVHIDQIIISLSQHCHRLERLEIHWDPDTIRYSDNSSKFIDQLRLKCQYIKSMTLSDGEYYEMVKSNFERAERTAVVRTTTNYQTSLVGLLSRYSDLLFN